MTLAVVRVGTIIAELERGPFQGEATHQNLRESTAELQAKASVNDPLLVRLVSKNLRHKGDDAVPDENVLNVRDSWHLARYMEQKPQKTAPTQWNTRCDAFEFVVPAWHERAASLMHMGCARPSAFRAFRR